MFSLTKQIIVSAFVTLNALRKHLRDFGCIEERVLHSPGMERFHIEFCCRTKSGRCCRAVIGTDRSGSRIPATCSRDSGDSSLRV
jgi:hypothetical protein